MFIINYKNYEFKIKITNNFEIMMTIDKNTLNDKINMIKIIIGENESFKIEDLPENLDLTKEENEKKFLTYIGFNIGNHIQSLLKKNEAFSRFKLEKYNVVIVSKINLNKNNYNLTLTIKNKDEKIESKSNVKFLSNGEYVKINTVNYNKLLADFSKNGNTEEFEKQINLNFANDMQKLVRFVFNTKNEILKKKKKEEKISLISSEYEESKKDKLKLNNQISLISSEYEESKKDKIILNDQIELLNEKLKNSMKKIAKINNKIILYKIGSGLSVVFLIVIIILFFKKKSN